MRGLDTLQRKTVEAMKEARTVRLSFPVGDGTGAEVTVPLRDREAIHRIALSVQGYYLRENEKMKAI